MGRSASYATLQGELPGPTGFLVSLPIQTREMVESFNVRPQSILSYRKSKLNDYDQSHHTEEKELQGKINSFYCILNTAGTLPTPSNLLMQ